MPLGKKMRILQVSGLHFQLNSPVGVEFPFPNPSLNLNFLLILSFFFCPLFCSTGSSFYFIHSLSTSFFLLLWSSLSHLKKITKTISNNSHKVTGMTPGPLHLKFLRVVGSLCFNFFPFHSLVFTLCHWIVPYMLVKLFLVKLCSSRHIKALVFLDFFVATEIANPSLDRLLSLLLFTLLAWSFAAL